MGIMASDSIELKSVIGQQTVDDATAGMVTGDRIISAINQSTEGVSISGEKISLEGTVTANDNFKINRDGSMETIAGDIGGWLISNDTLYRFFSIVTQAYEQHYMMRLVVNGTVPADVPPPYNVDNFFGVEAYRIDANYPSDIPLVIDPRFDDGTIVDRIGRYPSVPAEGYTADDLANDYFFAEYSNRVTLDPNAVEVWNRLTTGSNEFMRMAIDSEGVSVANTNTGQKTILETSGWIRTSNSGGSTYSYIGHDRINASNGSESVSSRPSQWGRVWTVTGTDKNIANASDVTLCQLSLPAGTYILSGTARFASNSTGAREIHFSNTNNGQSINRWASSGQKQPNGGGTWADRVVFTNTYTATTTVYLVGYQTSGGSLGVSQTGIKATRIV